MKAFQLEVEAWVNQCFGPNNIVDKAERNHRFLEEALELVQSCGMSQSEAHQLVDYVFGRPTGINFQEAGGTLTTLAALCTAQEIHMDEAANAGIAENWKRIDIIRAKQAAKPKHSPLLGPTDPDIRL